MKDKDYTPVEKGQVLKLVYDISSTPNGLDMANFTKLFESHNVVFWDSEKGGTKPQLYSVDGKILPAIVDTKGKELDLDYYSKLFTEAEFWDRELHRCKNSPIYFFSNYGTSVWPHTDEDLKKYMDEIGIGQVVAEDDEDAKKQWEKQKQILKDATKDMTIEFLQERKAYIDVIKARYEQKVTELETLLSSKVKLTDSKGGPIEMKEKVSRLVLKIRNNRPVLPKYSEKYRTSKGKWDTGMLYVTAYDQLLKIFYDVLQAKGEEFLDVDSPASDAGGAKVDTPSGEAVA